jgi:predicted nucleotide-binding protein
MDTRDNIADIKSGVQKVPIYDEHSKQSRSEKKRWENGKIGYFDDPDNNCLYRFIELVERDGKLGDPIYSEYDKENKNWYSTEKGRGCYYKQNARRLPVLASGFVGWLIKHWGTDTQAIYSGYLQVRLDQYKTEHKNDADVFKRDLEREFYDQYRTQEEQWVKQSEAIFEFISKPEENQIKEYVKYYFDYVSQKEKEMKKDMNSTKKNIFIVHGKDENVNKEVELFIGKFDLNPIILKDQPSGGRTIIEKIESNSNISYGIVIYSPCDVGAEKGQESNLKPRARQNVVFEHGYLIGKIGRKNVCALITDRGIEIPNDISGVVYVEMYTEDWKNKIAKEIKGAGIEIDLDRLL